MSTLSSAIYEKICNAKDKITIDEEEIERILISNQVSTSASIPTQSKLHINHLNFSGIKVLNGVFETGEETDIKYVKKVPFSFNWSLDDMGLYGVGSDRNSRGKSSVLHIIMWALRGKCRLQSDVQKWINNVELTFSVDSDKFQVIFDVVHEGDENIPCGDLIRLGKEKKLKIGSFNGNAEFEELMGSFMLEALKLPVITSQNSGKRVRYVWPTYSNALVIDGDHIKHLFGGNSAYGGIPSRLLSIFIGAKWAAARTEAATAHAIAKSNFEDLEKTIKNRTEAMNKAYEEALLIVGDMKKKLESITSINTIDIKFISESLLELPKLDTELSQLAEALQDARNTYAEANSQLKAEKAQRYKAKESQNTIRFFQNLKPTACPRCSTPVTAERVKSEVEEDICSICTTDIPMTNNPNHIAPPTTTGDDSSITDDLVALSEAVKSAKKRIDSITEKQQSTKIKRKKYNTLLETNSEVATLAQKRQNALIDLARAEGAVFALSPKDNSIISEQKKIDDLKIEKKILKLAEDILGNWVRDTQKQPLEEINSIVVNLARSFGVTNLTKVEITGAATMKIMKGSTRTNYGDIVRGERLKIKLATAIALIQQSNKAGVGRHPGILIVDSPQSEEIYDGNFEDILHALKKEAEAAKIQVFVGTRNTEQLSNIVGEDRCKFGKGDSFVW